MINCLPGRYRIPKVNWIPLHTNNKHLLDLFVSGNISNNDNIVSSGISDYDILQLLLCLNSGSRYPLRFIKCNNVHSKGVAGLHLRLGDFCNYSGYYKPDTNFIKKAIEYLPNDIHTIIVFSNGSKELVDELLVPIKDKYKIIIDHTSEDRPDIVLNKMMSCSALIRTGSTLSFCAGVIGNIPLVISSNNEKSVWSEHLQLDLPGWHYIIV